MKPSHNHLDRTWAEQRVEDFVDGLLPRKERKALEAMLATDDALAREVDLAIRLRDALRGEKAPACPASAYEPVLRMARREAGAERGSDIADWIAGLFRPRVAPARAIVVASALLAAILTTVVMIDRGAVEGDPNAEEVQEALNEIKVALAYVSLAGRETGSTIRRRAVDQAIIDPIVRAIGHAEIGSGVDNTEPATGVSIGEAKKGGES